jgi:hypothetical protein
MLSAVAMSVENCFQFPENVANKIIEVSEIDMHEFLRDLDYYYPDLKELYREVFEHFGLEYLLD